VLLIRQSVNHAIESKEIRSDTRLVLRKIKSDDFYVTHDPALYGGTSEHLSLVIISLGTNDW
jgi:hypothetical protein